MVDGPSWQKMRRIEIKNYQSKACPKEQSQAWCISSHSSSEKIKQTGKWTQWKAGHSGNTQKSAAFLYTRSNHLKRKLLRLEPKRSPKGWYVGSPVASQWPLGNDWVLWAVIYLTINPVLESQQVTFLGNFAWMGMCTSETCPGEAQTAPVIFPLLSVSWLPWGKQLPLPRPSSMMVLTHLKPWSSALETIRLWDKISIFFSELFLTSVCRNDEECNIEIKKIFSLIVACSLKSTQPWGKKLKREVNIVIWYSWIKIL